MAKCSIKNNKRIRLSDRYFKKREIKNSNE